jgi:hypothetical protein
VQVEEEDNIGFVAAILYHGRRLGDVLMSKASCGRLGTSVSVLEVWQHQACRCSGGVCGEAKGAEQGVRRRKRQMTHRG